MHRFNRPKWAVVVAALAVSLTLGGTGYASSRHNSRVQARGVAAAAVTWKSFTLKNSWVFGGYSTFHAGYYKDGQGIVHLRGSLAGGTSGYAFRLPAGYRPAKFLWLPIYTNSANAGGLEIDPNGKVYPLDPGGGSSVLFSSLDGVSFPVP